MSNKNAENYYDVKWINTQNDSQKKFFTKNNPKNLSQFFFREQYKIFKNILSKHQIQSDAKILEVGCGRGTTSVYLGLDNYSNLYLLDNSENSVVIAKDNFRSEHLRAQFVVENAKDMSFDSETFDVVFSMGLLEHFKDPQSIIDEKIRVLKKEGLFVAFILPQKLSADSLLNSLLKPCLIMLRKVERKFTKENKIVNNSQFKKKADKKITKLYRNKLMVDYYRNALFSQLQNIDSFWVNPFPFLTPTSKSSQNFLVRVYYLLLNVKKYIFRCNTPYATNSLMGNGFFIYGIKKNKLNRLSAISY